MKIKQLIDRYKLPAFLVTSILAAFLLVIISMNAYYSSGAFLIDMSSPEYKPVRPQLIVNPKKKNPFEAQGEITDKVMADFLSIYGDDAKQVLDAKAFSGDVLSDEQLGI